MVEYRHHIDRTPQLSTEIQGLMVLGGLDRRGLVTKAQIGSSTLARMLNPDDPQGVSSRSFHKVVVNLTDDFEQRRYLYQLAGLPVPSVLMDGFVSRMGEVLDDLALNTDNRRVLEESVMAHTLAMGSILKAVQEQTVAQPTRSRGRAS